MKAERGLPRAASDTDGRRAVAGLRVLVVEDVGMVAMALKSLLEDIGCVVVGPTARLRETEEAARREALDGVLLDLNLGGQYSYPVIDILRERGIPFIIMSGYDAGQLRPDLAEAPQMQKPFERESLEAMVSWEFSARSKDGRTTRRAPATRPAPSAKEGRKAPTRTLGELEATVCQGMSRFGQEYLGRGPKDVQAHLIGDLLVVRLHGALTAAERRLAECNPVEQGRDLLKQVRTLLIETARLQIDSMIQVITGVKVLSMHHDISTVTGEEVVVFALGGAPGFREAKASK